MLTLSGRIFVNPESLTSRELATIKERATLRQENGRLLQVSHDGRIYFAHNPLQPLPTDVDEDQFTNFTGMSIHNAWSPVTHRTTGFYGDEFGGMAIAFLERVAVKDCGDEYCLEVWGGDPRQVTMLWHDIRTGKAKPTTSFEAEQIK